MRFIALSSLPGIRWPLWIGLCSFYVTLACWMGLLPGVLFADLSILDAFVAPFGLQREAPGPWFLFWVGILLVGVFQMWFYAHRGGLEGAFKRGIVLHAGVVYGGSVWFVWPLQGSLFAPSPFGIAVHALLWGALGIMTAAFAPLALSWRFPEAVERLFPSHPNLRWISGVILVLSGTLIIASAMAGLVNIWHPGFQ